MVLHLTARMMATRTDKHNPHAALRRLALLISRHLLASADAMDEEARRHDLVYMQVSALG
ncbi:MAG TPA: hypothetical protein EYP17_04990 [Candidatus Latescibacteria bacterium]|nr:hypothetical protein [Candidatus Latescibacterota bacterium]